MAWIQKSFRLPTYRRGFHLITHLIEENVPELRHVKVGLAHIFIHHTSAGLTLNENADPIWSRRNSIQAIARSHS